MKTMQKKTLIVLLAGLIWAAGSYAQNRADATTAASPTVQTQRKGLALKRKKPSERLQHAMEAYMEAVERGKVNIHSVMVLQHGKVLYEKWLGEGAPGKPHVLHSVSKTFTSTAVGLAVGEGLLSVDDKVISFFPDKVPANPSENLRKMTVRDLLTMTCGHDPEPSAATRNREGADWVEGFLSWPVDYEPGTRYCYNSMGTYMLSAIVQKVTGQKIVDYLQPRLFDPLGIQKPHWEESPQGINCGGWGLYLRTEDLAKMGQLLLNKGRWHGRQILSAEWVKEASSRQVPCQPAGTKPEQVAERGLTPEKSDWVQGYGYQMWRCRHNAFRADGAYGQYIIVMPDQDAVVVNTAQQGDLQAELNLVWDYILPALSK